MGNCHIHTLYFHNADESILTFKWLLIFSQFFPFCIIFLLVLKKCMQKCCFAFVFSFKRVLTSTFFLKAEITCLHNIHVSNVFLALACITYLRLDLNEPSLSLVAYFRLHNHSFLGGHFEAFYRITKFDKVFC